MKKNLGNALFVFAMIVLLAVFFLIVVATAGIQSALTGLGFVLLSGAIALWAAKRHNEHTY